MTTTSSMKDIHPGHFRQAIRAFDLDTMLTTFKASGGNVLRMDDYFRHPDVTDVAHKISMLERRATTAGIPDVSTLFDYSTTGSHMFMTISWAWFCWRECREQVYRVSDGLAEVIKRSNEMVNKVKIDDFILPHTALYLKLPPWWTITNVSTGLHPVEGVYLIDTIGSDSIIRERAGWEGRSRYLVCLITAGPGSNTVGTPDESTDDEVFHAPLRLAPGTTLADAFADGRKVTFGKLSPHEWDTMGTVEEIVRFAVGAMVYATSANAELTVHFTKEYHKARKSVAKLSRRGKGNALRKAQERLANLSTRRTVELGGSVTSPDRGVGKPWGKPRFVCSHEQTYWVRGENIPGSVAGERKWITSKINDNDTELFKIRRYKVGGWYGIKDGEEPPKPDGREHVLS